MQPGTMGGEREGGSDSARQLHAPTASVRRAARRPCAQRHRTCGIIDRARGDSKHAGERPGDTLGGRARDARVGSSGLGDSGNGCHVIALVARVGQREKKTSRSEARGSARWQCKTARLHAGIASRSRSQHCSRRGCIITSVWAQACDHDIILRSSVNASRLCQAQRVPGATVSRRIVAQSAQRSSGGGKGCGEGGSRCVGSGGAAENADREDSETGSHP